MPQWYWICKSAAVLLGVASVMWLALAIAWDQWKRRNGKLPHCRACWYSMEGATSLTCPECGCVAKNATDLQRPRRRYGQAMIAVLCVALCYHLWLVPLRHKRGERWTSLIPTTVLVWTTPLKGLHSGDPFVEAVWYRSRESWTWQQNILAARQIIFTSNAELRSCVHTRAVWPENAAILFEARLGDSMYSLAGIRLLDIRSTDGRGLHLQTGDEHPIPPGIHVFRRGPGYPSTAPHFALVDPPSVGTQKFSFISTLSGPWGIHRSAHHTVTIDVVPPAECGLAPMDTPEVREVLAKAMRVSWSERSWFPWLQINMDDQQIFETLYRSRYKAGLKPVFDPRIAVRIEIRDGDRILWSMADLDSNYPAESTSCDAMRDLAWDGETGNWKRSAMAHWTVHVLGDLALAAQDFQAQHYWSGEIVLPMKDVIKQTDEDPDPQ